MVGEPLDEKFFTLPSKTGERPIPALVSGWGGKVLKGRVAEGIHHVGDGGSNYGGLEKLYLFVKLLSSQIFLHDLLQESH